MRIHSNGRGRCRYKKRISSKKHALAAAHKMTKTLGEPMQAYKCLECHCWHIGHAERYRDREKRYVAALERDKLQITVLL